MYYNYMRFTNLFLLHSKQCLNLYFGAEVVHQWGASRSLCVCVVSASLWSSCIFTVVCISTQSFFNHWLAFMVALFSCFPITVAFCLCQVIYNSVHVRGITFGRHTNYPYSLPWKAFSDVVMRYIFFIPMFATWIICWCVWRTVTVLDPQMWPTAQIWTQMKIYLNLGGLLNFSNI